jgi:hypothetical protein
LTRRQHKQPSRSSCFACTVNQWSLSPFSVFVFEMGSLSCFNHLASSTSLFQLELLMLAELPDRIRSTYRKLDA